MSLEGTGAGMEGKGRRHAKVFVTRDIPVEGFDRLAACPWVDFEYYRGDGAVPREELLEAVKGVDGLICLLSDRIDAEVMDSAPALKVIANYAVGYDNIDVGEATGRGIWVCNTPGVLTEATADLAFALLLAAARRIVEADRFTRRGLFKGWAPRLLTGADIHGATLGIVGMGRIGRALARRAGGFGMKIVYHNRKALPHSLEAGLEARWMGLDELLRVADFVSVHVPGGEETRHLLDARRLALMKPGAVIVNTARGSVIDEAALVAALRERRIRAAGLDVFEREPELHEGLAELDNVVLAPHIGSATDGTRSRMAVMAADNVLAGLAGLVPPNAVNDPVEGRCGG